MREREMRRNGLKMEGRLMGWEGRYGCGGEAHDTPVGAGYTSCVCSLRARRGFARGGSAKSQT